MSHTGGARGEGRIYMSYLESKQKRSEKEHVGEAGWGLDGAWDRVGMDGEVLRVAS